MLFETDKKPLTYLLDQVQEKALALWQDRFEEFIQWRQGRLAEELNVVTGPA